MENGYYSLNALVRSITYHWERLVPIAATEESICTAREGILGYAE